MSSCDASPGGLVSKQCAAAELSRCQLRACMIPAAFDFALFRVCDDCVISGGGQICNQSIEHRKQQAAAAAASSVDRGVRAGGVSGSVRAQAGTARAARSVVEPQAKLGGGPRVLAAPVRQPAARPQQEPLLGLQPRAGEAQGAGLLLQAPMLQRQQSPPSPWAARCAANRWTPTPPAAARPPPPPAAPCRAPQSRCRRAAAPAHHRDPRACR